MLPSSLQLPLDTNPFKIPTLNRNVKDWRVVFVCLPHQGGGCGLMTRTRKFEEIVKGMNYVSGKLIWWEASCCFKHWSQSLIVLLGQFFCSYVGFFFLLHVYSQVTCLSCVKVLDVPLTVKIRTGVQEKTNIAHKLIPEMKKWGVSMITVSHVKKRSAHMKTFLNLWFDPGIGLLAAARPVQRAALHQTSGLGLHLHVFQAGQSRPTFWSVSNASAIYRSVRRRSELTFSLFSQGMETFCLTRMPRRQKKREFLVLWLQGEIS